MANKKLLKKSINYFVITLFCMFMAPGVLYQAFKNKEHLWYIPILIIGVILAITAVALGFYSVKTLVKSLYSKNKT